jgi:hypothetical protein
MVSGNRVATTLTRAGFRAACRDRSDLPMPARKHPVRRRLCPHSHTGTVYRIGLC